MQNRPLNLGLLISDAQVDIQTGLPTGLYLKYKYDKVWPRKKYLTAVNDQEVPKWRTCYRLGEGKNIGRYIHDGKIARMVTGRI